MVGAVVVAEDMTEIREAEAVAAASEQRLRLAHEAAELGSWHWDMATGVTVWDEQLEAIYGMPPGGFDGTFEAWEATVHPDDHDEVMAVVQEAVAARSSYVLRNRMFWPDGTMRWIEAHGKVTTDEQGNPTGTIGCVRDVTDRVTVAGARGGRGRAGPAAAGGDRRLRPAPGRSTRSRRSLAASLRAGRRDPAATASSSGSPRTSRPSPTAARSWRAAERPLSPEDTQLLDTLAVAVRDRRRARHARRRGPPTSPSSCSPAWPRARCPTLERFELAVHYAPGGDELEHVGGDWYDAVRTPDRARWPSSSAT